MWWLSTMLQDPLFYYFNHTAFSAPNSVNSFQVVFSKVKIKVYFVPVGNLSSAYDPSFDAEATPEEQWAALEQLSLMLAWMLNRECWVICTFFQCGFLYLLYCKVKRNWPDKLRAEDRTLITDYNVFISDGLNKQKPMPWSSCVSLCWPCEKSCDQHSQGHSASVPMLQFQQLNKNQEVINGKNKGKKC